MEKFMPSSIPFSVRLEPELKNRLEKEAKGSSRSASYVVVKAVEKYLQGKEVKRKAIQEAVNRASEGVFISQEAVHQWVDSWAEGNEVPIPKADVFLKNK